MPGYEQSERDAQTHKHTGTHRHTQTHNKPAIVRDWQKVEMESRSKSWCPDLHLYEPSTLFMSRACHRPPSQPSVLIASTTDILAFLSAAATPVPAIKYFCMTCGLGLTIALVLLFTWYTAWMKRIGSRRRRCRTAKN